MTNFGKWRSDLTIEKAISLLATKRCSEGICPVLDKCQGFFDSCEQNIKEWLEDDPDNMRPNVRMIRDEGFRIITKLGFRQVRNELYEAVKKGQLGRLPKDGMKPEVFFHPDCKSKAEAARTEIALERLEKLKRIVVTGEVNNAKTYPA